MNQLAFKFRVQIDVPEKDPASVRTAVQSFVNQMGKKGQCLVIQGTPFAVLVDCECADDAMLLQFKFDGVLRGHPGSAIATT